MNPMRTVSAAVLLAATLAAAPAFAATTTTPAKAAPMAAMAAPKVTMAMKSDVGPISGVIRIIGKWTPAELAALGKASAIKTFDVKSLYPAADQTKVASAETANSARLGKLHAALRADASLNIWLTKNKIDVDHVVAVSTHSSGAHIFVY